MAHDQDEERPEDVSVTLKPILGVAPETYVPVAYGIALLVILFFVFVFPGIRHHGSLVSVVSVPPEASVIVDGVRVGTSPGSFFIESGAREIQVRRPGFAPWTERVEIPGRLVGSWLFPRRADLRAELTGSDPDALTGAALRDLAAWTVAGEASGQYQFPPIARRLAADLRAAGLSSAAGSAGRDAATDALTRFIDAAFPQIASAAIVKDVAAAALSSGGESGVVVPAGIETAVRALARATQANPLLPLQLSSATRNEAFTAGRWFDVAVAEARGRVPLTFEGSAALAGTTRRAPLDLDFVALPGGRVVLGGADRAARGGDVPYETTIVPFEVGTTEVPFSAFAAFVEANPRWRFSNREELIRDNLVDESYLDSIEELRADPSLPVTGVSWHAAAAFAEWYSTLLPDQLVARLPSEAEWSFAQRVAGTSEGVFAGGTGPVSVSDAEAGRAGITGIIGNVWEWTGDWFAPFGTLYPGSDALPAAHRVVRGGGWATERLGFHPDDRGSLPPEWSSPFVGFRLVIAER